MTAVLLFGLGLGWNLSFVAATAQLADRSSAAERGTLLGFNDLGSALLGAALALLGGAALEAVGVAALALGAAAIVLLPVILIFRLREVGAGGFEPPKAEPTGLQPVPFGHSGTPPGGRAIVAMADARISRVRMRDLTRARPLPHRPRPRSGRFRRVRFTSSARHRCFKHRHRADAAPSTASSRPEHADLRHQPSSDGAVRCPRRRGRARRLDAAFRLARAARACYSSTRRGSRATSRAAAASPSVRSACCPSPWRPSSRRRSTSSSSGSAIAGASCGHRGAARRHDPTTVPRRLPGRAGAGGGRGVSRRCDCGRDRRHGCDRRRRRQRLVREVGGHVHEVALEGNVPYGPVSRGVTHRGRRVRDRPGRLRLGLPEGRPRQRRRRGWLHQGPHLREHLARLCRGGSRRTRSPTSAATGSRCDGRNSPRGAEPRSSAMRPASSIRSPATASTKPCSAPGSQLRTHWRSSPAAPTISALCRDIGSRARALHAASWRASFARAFPERELHAAPGTLCVARDGETVASGPPPIRERSEVGGAALRAAELLARLAGDPARHSRGQRERLRPLFALTAVAAVALALSSAASADIRDDRARRAALPVVRLVEQAEVRTG